MEKFLSRDLLRNIIGRFDLFRILLKWDKEYRKEVTVTGLAVLLIIYSLTDIDSIYDYIALGLEFGILFMQLGAEMSIMPNKYRPSVAGLHYRAKNSTHFIRDGISYPMDAVEAMPQESAYKFYNPFKGTGLSTESALVSDSVDDRVMTMPVMPYKEVPVETNYICSTHQIRYIAIRVASKVTHTTNGEKLALHCTAAQFMADDPTLPLRKGYYYDGLLTLEAFRSIITRGNIHGNEELFTNMTNYFPVSEKAGKRKKPIYQFDEDLYEKVSGHIGITTLLVTKDRNVAMLYQGTTKAIDAGKVALGGSGSLDYEDTQLAGNPDDFRGVISRAMSRELHEETGHKCPVDHIWGNTLITGFFRWVDRCGKPEFVGITRIKDYDMSEADGDEITKIEEIPIQIKSLKDFHKVYAYVREKNVKVSLSSLVCLHRMTIIADYDKKDATKEQKALHKQVSDLVLG